MLSKVVLLTCDPIFVIQILWSIAGPQKIIINVIKDLQDFGQKYATIFYINSMQNFYEIFKNMQIKLWLIISSGS